MVPLHPVARARLEKTTDPAIVLSLDHRILAANRAYLTRYGQIEPGQTRCYQASHGYQQPCHLEGETCPARAAILTGRPSRVRHLHRHGTCLEACDIETVPIEDGEGRTIQLLEVMHPLDSRPRRGGLVGDSPAMQEVYRLIDAVAPHDVPVLLLGETGTGKELAAHALHEASPRRVGPLVAVELPGLAEGVFESELFGHERGAFTGADRRKDGLIDAARGGTLFLDEIGDLSPTMQVKLLRLLEAGTFRRVGSTEPHRADFRLIAATHRDLTSMVLEGRFRADLYYRISTFPIRLPPLRERLEDLDTLVPLLLGAGELSPPAYAALRSRPWPGNVRELRNTLERARILANGGKIEPEHLSGPSSAPPATDHDWPWGTELLPIEAVEDRYVRWAAAHSGLTRRELAAHLGLSERQLYRRLGGG